MHARKSGDLAEAKAEGLGFWGSLLKVLWVIITHVMFCAMKTEMLVELYDVARLMRTRFDRWARTYGMTRAQGVILARLARQPGMTQNEMAGLCEVEPITVGRLVDRLEARGLLERRLDPADRRIRRLHLLPACRADPEGDPALQGRTVPRNHRRAGREPRWTSLPTRF